MGNTILSITGRQKINNTLYKSKNTYVSFNGEIYNYKSIIEKFYKKIF